MEVSEFYQLTPVPKPGMVPGQKGCLEPFAELQSSEATQEVKSEHEGDMLG
jgi:hypothetical protein